MGNTQNEQSPIGFNKTAFAADGEVDEANLFLPDDAHTAEDALNVLLAASLEQANDEAEAVSREQADGEAAGEPLAVDEGFDELEALLQESLQPVREKQALRANREKLARGGLSANERKEIEAKVREWEARLEWDNEANVALFHRQTCSKCELTWTTFSTLLLRQSHKTKADTQRWIASSVELAALPNEVAFRDQTVGMCWNCCDSRGYRGDEGYELIGD